MKVEIKPENTEEDRRQNRNEDSNKVGHTHIQTDRQHNSNYVHLFSLSARSRDAIFNVSISLCESSLDCLKVDVEEEYMNWKRKEQIIRIGKNGLEWKH